MRRETRGYVYAVLTAVAFAGVPVLAKVGLRGAHYLTGITLAVWSGTALVGLGLLLTGQGRGLATVDRWTARFIALYAVTNLGAITSNYASLVHIPVVVSAPITATYPAFALLFGFLLQRRTEVITPRVVAGTLAIVAGGMILVW